MTSLNDLHAFCYYLAQKYDDLDTLSEEKKAEEFRKMSALRSPVNISDLRDVASCCEIKVDALVNMPANLRGFHEVYGEKKKIYYKHGDVLSGIENTILHEIREMMEPHFAEVCLSYKPLDNDTLHNRCQPVRLGCPVAP
jgi:hypothetical protein